MCTYVRFVHHFRFFRFSAQGCSQVHGGAHRCKKEEVLCSCVKLWALNDGGTLIDTGGTIKRRKTKEGRALARMNANFSPSRLMIQVIIGMRLGDYFDGVNPFNRLK